MFAVLCAIALQPSGYVMEVISSPGLSTGWQAINESGQMAGSAVAGYESRAMRYTPGIGVEELRYIPNVHEGGGDITESGDVCVSGGYQESRWADRYSDYGGFENAAMSFGRAMNDHGVMVGGVYWGYTYAVSYNFANSATLSLFRESVYAAFSDINNSDVAVGVHNYGYDRSVAVVFAKDRIVELPPFSSEPFHKAISINDVGVILGQSYTTNRYTGWIYSGGVYHELQKWNGLPYDVRELNDDGSVIGYATLDSTHSFALLWKDYVPISLTDSTVNRGDFTVTQAIAINNRGQIIARVHNGILGQNVILTPVGAPVYYFAKDISAVLGRHVGGERRSTRYDDTDQWIQRAEMGVARTELSSNVGFDRFDAGQLAVAISSTSRAKLTASAYNFATNEWVDLDGAFEIGPEQSVVQFNFSSNVSDFVGPGDRVVRFRLDARSHGPEATVRLNLARLELVPSV